MNNLPALQTDDIEQEELMGRIALSNRPALDVDLEFIDAVAADLAADSRRRKLFVDDPAAYLNMRDLPVSDCRLVAPDVSVTSEAATALANITINIASLNCILLGTCTGFQANACVSPTCLVIANGRDANTDIYEAAPYTTGSIL